MQSLAENTVRSESRLHLGYGTYIWLSVSKLPLKCAVVSLYSVVKQRLKCNTGKVCNGLIRFLLTMVRGHNFQHLCKRTATFRTYCIIAFNKETEITKICNYQQLKIFTLATAGINKLRDSLAVSGTGL
jgi:hypothetical protein